MHNKEVVSDLMLLTTAALWGFAFVAQRIGMDYIGPHLFNGLRFLLGALILLPFLIHQYKNNKQKITLPLKGIPIGIILFLGAAFQQMGIVTTTAGNAGFITGLYLVIVPFIGIFLKQRLKKENLLGAAIATIGLYLLTITQGFNIHTGDLYILIAAFFWAAHVQLIGLLAPKNNPLGLAISQYLVCSLLSLSMAFFFEPISHTTIQPALPAILYGGIISVGIAFSLQLYAQRHAPANHAAILLSLESAFAAFGGWLLLSETWTQRTLIGCLLMLMGMFISQIGRRKEIRQHSQTMPYKKP